MKISISFDKELKWLINFLDKRVHDSCCLCGGRLVLSAGHYQAGKKGRREVSFQGRETFFPEKISGGPHTYLALGKGVV